MVSVNTLWSLCNFSLLNRACLVSDVARLTIRTLGSLVAAEIRKFVPLSREPTVQSVTLDIAHLDKELLDLLLEHHGLL